MQTNRGKMTDVYTALIANEPKLRIEEIIEEDDEPEKVVPIEKEE